ncbi:DUF55-domain-containing protein [Gloeophyllum trabeum ATCC 11539]|uniref:DUF55-domain-containing protein n=1 Tax=Gloeophyllum trabeum (strain ATCC 11539 / FP-39264 / Madison 617) TaxID=670483 RepID=S7QIA5_GLOTA|nr:DUF55-domain-containing protein [Gloeophyllum trabeum ATCC 11539]EPQ58927.1 DUF55-domain-containing protein [Gloeophyllum trabeum ATCC 11539]
MAVNYWLMKAEPDSRIIKGMDVKFSVDDFECLKTTAWEGVRNHEAKNLMKSMKVGDQVLFYHSNCKDPGIAGFAEVCKEAYPDYTAWDTSHPYYDPKTDKDNPRWYMVDLAFKSRAKHFVPLSLLRHIAALPSNTPPSSIEYLGEDGVQSIKTMALVTRGRLSVQKVEQNTWDALQLLAERGGWEDLDLKGKEKGGKRGTAKNAKAGAGSKKGNAANESGEEEVSEEQGEKSAAGRGRKRKTADEDEATPRRSTRTRAKK